MLSKFIMDLSHFIILIFLLFNDICTFSLSLASFLQPYMVIFFFFSFMINIDNIGTFISLFLFLRSQCIWLWILRYHISGVCRSRVISPTALLVGIVMTVLIQVCVSVIDINGNEKEAQRGEVGGVERERERERERKRGRVLIHRLLTTSARQLSISVCMLPKELFLDYDEILKRSAFNTFIIRPLCFLSLLCYT